MFIGTSEYIVWQTGLRHNTSPDLVHNAQLRYSEIFPSVDNIASSDERISNTFEKPSFGMAAYRLIYTGN